MVARGVVMGVGSERACICMTGDRVNWLQQSVKKTGRRKSETKAIQYVQCWMDAKTCKNAYTFVLVRIKWFTGAALLDS